jgi:hypothetical protein
MENSQLKWHYVPDKNGKLKHILIQPDIKLNPPFPPSYNSALLKSPAWTNKIWQKIKKFFYNNSI